MQRRRFAGAAGLALVSRALPARAQTRSPLTALLHERVQHEGLGFVAALTGRDGVEFAAAGRRASDSADPPDADSIFEYGSITKTFVALLLAEMSLRKDLALDEPVEAALGQRLRDSVGAPITWADLATHRSGLPRLPGNLQPKVASDPYADYGVAQLKAFIAAWKPELPRQSRWEYSNLGFGLLGHALALRGGKPFAALLSERVLVPLGLSGMQVALTGSAPGGLLQGHDAQGKPVPRWHFDALAGAGALLGSARSLARYAQAALGLIDTALAPAFAICLRQHGVGPVAANPIGLAWILAPLNGRRIAVHDGGTFGFSSSLILDLERGRAALVLANAMVGVNDLALHALEPGMPPRDLAAEKRQTQRKAVALDAATLAALSGIYALSSQFKLAVRLRDGKLLAQATGQGEFELFAIDARRFFARITALEVQFDGDSGVPAGLTLEQGGQRLRFVRE